MGAVSTKKSFQIESIQIDFFLRNRLEVSYDWSKNESPRRHLYIGGREMGNRWQVGPIELKKRSQKISLGANRIESIRFEVGEIMHGMFPLGRRPRLVATGAGLKSKHDMYLIRGSVGA